MKLELNSLKSAITALKRSLHTAEKYSKTADEELSQTLQSGVIHNFKIAYELSWKFIQQWLRNNTTIDNPDQPRTRKDLFRQAALFGLIADSTAWFEYGDARNLTSHTYDETIAQVVFDSANAFLSDVEYLYTQLETKND